MVPDGHEQPVVAVVVVVVTEMKLGSVEGVSAGGRARGIRSGAGSHGSEVRKRLKADKYSIPQGARQSDSKEFSNNINIQKEQRSIYP